MLLEKSNHQNVSEENYELFENKIRSMDLFQLRVVRKLLRNRERSEWEDKLLELVLERIELLKIGIKDDNENEDED